MPPQKSPPKKILVVDDEPLVCEAVKMMLEFDGHEVVAAANATEALELFAQNRFDLVFTDYKMPGMRGDQLALAIKAGRPDQPVVMLTAHAEIIRSEGVPLAGVDHLINKPFQLADLRSAIEKATVA
jgi:two-component system, cell cycle response regulator CpdR